MKKTISILTPTYNEAENIEKLCLDISNEMKKMNYEYEHIIIDNCSTDNTIPIIKKIAEKDKRVKIIINSKNFGIIRSPTYGIMQTSGDAVIYMNADFQDPVELIPKYIKKWEEGAKIVLGEKNSSKESSFIFSLRKIFYYIINKISDVDLTQNTTGSGIFDKKIVDYIKTIEDPYPYFRGLLSELGYTIETIKFDQPKRLHGSSKLGLFILYDYAMLGIVKHSRLPLRLMTIIGFVTSILSILVALAFFIYKLFYWNSFELGIAPLIIGIFGIGSIQIFLLGLIGEYVGVLLIHARKLPMVIEKERINF